VKCHRNEFGAQCHFKALQKIKSLVKNEEVQTMSKPIRILLQTTIPTTEDDWSIERFSLLRDYLASLKDEEGNPLCKVTARDRSEDADGNDPVLSTLGDSDFDELWLFALDTGGGLSPKIVQASQPFINRVKGFLQPAIIKIWVCVCVVWVALAHSTISNRSNNIQMKPIAALTILIRKRFPGLTIIPDATATIKPLSPSNPFTNFYTIPIHLLGELNFSQHILMKVG
jgi:hypothetical protein